MSLPFLVSLPHAGLSIPPELETINALTTEDIARDGDGGAWEIYHGLENICAGFQTTDIARAYVDLNRAPDDLGPDGVIKQHTTWRKPIYTRYPDTELIRHLIDKYWRPYHERLTELSGCGAVLGIDCHTMEAIGPPVGPDTGRQRPMVCLGNADGTCPEDWINGMAECLNKEFGDDVKINDPFRGGYITRAHSKELPWLQIELSRALSLTPDQKRDRVLSAIERWSEKFA